MQSHRSNWRRHAGFVFIVSLVLAASAIRPTSAVADGALAVALPDDVVKKGFAYGYVTDYPDADKADAQALKKCRDTTIDGVRPLCEVIQDFKNQCVAVAMDPQAGTPGAVVRRRSWSEPEPCRRRARHRLAAGRGQRWIHLRLFQQQCRCQSCRSQGTGRLPHDQRRGQGRQSAVALLSHPGLQQPVSRSPWIRQRERPASAGRWRTICSAAKRSANAWIPPARAAARLAWSITRHATATRNSGPGGSARLSPAS
jgi:hypothetical protein